MLPPLGHSAKARNARNARAAPRFFDNHLGFYGRPSSEMAQDLLRDGVPFFTGQSSGVYQSIYVVIPGTASVATTCSRAPWDPVAAAGSASSRRRAAGGGRAAATAAMTVVMVLVELAVEVGSRRPSS